MKKLLFLAAAAALAACGQSGGAGGPQGASGAPCPILANASAALGAPAPGIDVAESGMAMACQWRTEDGAIDASFIAYGPGGEDTADARMTRLVGEWSANASYPAEQIAGLGDAATLVKGMGGNQAQIVMRKGESVALVLASSGNARLDSEAAVRRLAAAVAAEWTP